VRARRLCVAIVIVCGLVLVSRAAHAQPAEAPESSDRPSSPFAALGWQVGPTKGALGSRATVSVPEGYRFLGQGDAGKFMELNQNPSDGSELGVLLNDDGGWFAVFEFSEDGYIKDDDRDLDADALLASVREGTKSANDLRAERGWSPVQIVGWQQKPFYDSRTNNLTWSIVASSEGGEGVNHSTRLLGRRGVMRVNLVAAREDIAAAVLAFNTVMGDFSFNPGQRYAEFRKGDKIAEYGLTGLIVGGAGVALVKTGLLQKFWKLIVLGVIAVAGALKKFIGGLGRPNASSDQPSTNV
jgi:uncharacterized membrane-anchored protein